MKFLATSDLHFSPRPKDSYRWEIFPWLEKQAKLRGVEHVFFLGDILDQKDRHPNDLINRLVDSFRELRDKAGVSIHMLAGNHDYTDPNWPLLRFLRERGLDFYAQPTLLRIAETKILMVPNQKSQIKFWEILESYANEDLNFVFLHQTFRGSLVSNGAKMEGLDPEKLRKVLDSATFISGDIHVPQTIGPLIYCGSPYVIHFGDTFSPRVLFWTGEELKSIKRATLKKAVLEITSLDQLEDQDLSEGDHVKVIMRLPRSRFGDWEEQRSLVEAVAKKHGWRLQGTELQEAEGNTKAPLIGKPKSLDSEELLKQFCQAHGIDYELAKMGVELLTD